jgi:hypothetical protein
VDAALLLQVNDFLSIISSSDFSISRSGDRVQIDYLP